MKVLLLLFFATLLQANANSFAQGITLKGRNISIERIFLEIRKQTGIAVLCESEVLETVKPLTVNFNGTPVKDVLEFCLKQTTYTYQFEKNSVVIKTITPSERSAPAIVMLQKIITGKVTNEHGNALDGVSVRTNNNIGTATAADGTFSLSMPDDVTSITFSYVGYESRTVTLAGR